MKTTVIISNEYIKVLCGGGKKKIVPQNAYLAPTPKGSVLGGVITDDTALGLAVADMWKKYNLPQKDIELVIDSGAINTKLLTLPALADKLLMGMVRNNFSDLENPDDMVFDYTIINYKNADGGYTVLACAADKDFLGSYIELFEKQQIKLEKIDISVNCEIRLVSKLSALKNKTFILAVADKSHISTSLFVNGAYRFSSRSRLVSAYGSEEYMGEITQLLSSMVQFNRSEKTGFEVENIYIGGLKSDAELICGRIKSALTIETAPFSKFAEIDLKKAKLYDGSESTLFRSADLVHSLGAIID